MGIGRRPTDDKIEVLASVKISRVVLSKILKLFDFYESNLKYKRYFQRMQNIQDPISERYFLLFGDTFLPKNRPHR